VSRLVKPRRQLRRALLLLLLLVVLRGLVEVRAQAMGARRARGVLLLLLILALGRHTLGDLLLLLRRSLALCDAVLAVSGLLESLRALAVYCQRWSVSRLHAVSTGRPTAHLPDGFGDDWTEVASTDWCERFDFLENIDGIASRWPRGAAREGGAGDSSGLPQLRITTAINRRMTCNGGPVDAQSQSLDPVRQCRALSDTLASSNMPQPTFAHLHPISPAACRGAEQRRVA
jgi:hypothetical protein